MPKLPMPEPPSPATPLKVLRKILRGAKKGIRDTVDEIKEAGKELKG